MYMHRFVSEMFLTQGHLTRGDQRLAVERRATSECQVRDVQRACNDAAEPSA